MNGSLWPFTASKESCNCPRGCRWFRCGQPGAQEHVYKCEVFYATAGNYIDNPASVAAIKQTIAHVLGYTSQPLHEFGLCGKLWTIAALYYRMRDGPMASSFALLLTPRPVPVPLVQTVTKLAKTEKPYIPRSHRLFDSNPFNGLGIGRSGVEKKEFLSHVAHAVWSAHASWVAKQCLGVTVEWSKWHFAHIAPNPAQLLNSKSPQFNRRLKNSRSLNMSRNKDLPAAQNGQWVFVNPSSTPQGSASESPSTPEPDQPTTPTVLQPRPQSFAGFARWEIQHGKAPSSRPAAPLPTSRSVPLQLSRRSPEPPARLLAASKRNSLVMLESNGSTYYLANDSSDGAIAVDEGDDDDIPLRRLSLAV